MIFCQPKLRPPPPRKIDRGGGGDGGVWCLGTEMSHTKFQVCISMRSLIRSFCKINRGGGGVLVWVDTLVSHTKFQVCVWIRSLIRSFCKIDRGGVGGWGGGLSLGWHCGVTYQILGLYVNLFSHKEFFAKLIRVGGGGGGGLVWVGTMVSHTKFQVSMSIRSLIRSFCKIDTGGGSWVLKWEVSI